MKIDLRAGDVEVPVKWDTDTYQRVAICGGCGGALEYGTEHPHTVVDCLRHLRDVIAEAKR